MRPAAVALGVLAAVVGGQVAYSQAFTSGFGAPVTTADIANAVAAATPAPCTAPLPDTLTGSAGTGAPCMSRPDATRPTQVQPVAVSTAADGSFTANWPTAFSSTPTIATADALGGVPPYICAITTKTATSVSGKCYQVVANTLPTTATALLGLVVSPIANPGAGLTVMIVGRL